MSTNAPLTPDVVYPESDGRPMADNTLQWDWMVKIVGAVTRSRSFFPSWRSETTSAPVGETRRQRSNLRRRADESLLTRPRRSRAIER